MLAPLLPSTSVPVLQIIDHHSRLFTPMERSLPQASSSTIKPATIASTALPVMPHGVNASPGADHVLISSLSSMSTPAPEPTNLFHHHHLNPSRPLYQPSTQPGALHHVEHPIHVRTHPGEKTNGELHSGLTKRFSWTNESTSNCRPHAASALNDMHIMTPTTLSGTFPSMTQTAFDNPTFPSAPIAGTFAGHSVISSSSKISSSTTFSSSASPSFYESSSSTIPTSSVSYSNMAFMAGSNPPLDPPMMLLSMSNPAMMTPYSMATPVTFSPAAQEAIPMTTSHTPEQSGDQLLTLEAGIDIATQGSLAGVREPVQKHMSSPESSALGHSGLKMSALIKPEEPRLVPMATSGSSSSTAKYDEDTPKKSHYCNWPNCHKTFTRSAHLARHARSHGGEKPYACPHNGCGKQFARSDVLKEHIRIHDANKIRKRKARDPSDPNKTTTATKSNAASTIAAPTSNVAAQQANSQHSVVPPPLTRTPDEMGAATTEIFPSVPRSTLSTPYQHPQYHSLQQQQQSYRSQEQYSQHDQYSQHSSQYSTMQNQGSTFGNQQLNHQGSTFFLPAQGLSVGNHEVPTGQQLSHSSTNPHAANSPPVYSRPTDGSTATSDTGGNGQCINSLASVPTGFTGLNYSQTPSRPSLPHMNMNNTPMAPTRSYSMSRVEDARLMQQDTPMNSYPGTFGYPQQTTMQQQPPFNLRERPMSMAALPTFTIQSAKPDSIGQDTTIQGMSAPTQITPSNQDVDISQRADKNVSLSMMTIENLRVTESNLLQRDWV